MGLVGEDAEPIVLRVEIRKSNHPNSALTLHKYPRWFAAYQWLALLIVQI